MRLCILCISCMELPPLPKRARFLSEPPPNRPQTASKSRHSCALLRLPKEPAQRAPGDPDCRQPGQNHQQNFRKSLSQKYPNSFSQNTKDHLHYPGSDCTKFSNSAATCPSQCSFLHQHEEHRNQNVNRGCNHSAHHGSGNRLHHVREKLGNHFRKRG